MPAASPPHPGSAPADPSRPSAAVLIRRIALRRAARAAIVVPLTVLVFPMIPVVGHTSLIGVFGTMTLLVYSDFIGPLPRRAVDYLGATAAGIPNLLVGITFGQSLAGAMAVMAAVALVIGIVGVLRSSFAAAKTPLLLATIVAVTTAPAGSQVSAAVSWVVGGLVATAAALLLWPARPIRAIHRATAHVYADAAAATGSRWGRRPDPAAHQAALTSWDDSLRQLHEHVDGNLLRPDSATSSERLLTDLIVAGERLRSYQDWVDVAPGTRAGDAVLNQSSTGLADGLTDALRQCAATAGHDAALPDPAVLADLRSRHLRSVAGWVAAARPEQPADLIRRKLDDLFPLRASALTAEVVALSGTQASGFTDPTLGYAPRGATRGPWRRVAAQTHWHSPWFRSALRTAIALAVSVGVARLSGLDHDFWIVLGTMTALRFDALGTGRTAAQMLIGTTAGVVAAAGLLLVFPDTSLLLWTMLPVALFAQAYTPGPTTMIFNQASATVAMLMLFWLVDQATLDLAGLRVLDVVIGLGISLIVSALIWPRGVVATLAQRLLNAAQAAGEQLVLAIDLVAGGAVDDDMLVASARRASLAREIAEETYDLAAASRPPRTVPLREWAALTMAVRHLQAAANMLPGFRAMAPGGEPLVPPALIGPLLTVTHDLRGLLPAIVDDWAEAGPDDRFAAGASPPLPDSVRQLRTEIDQWLAAPSDWPGPGADPRPAALVWLTDIAVFTAWTAAQLARVPAPADTR